MYASAPKEGRVGTRSYMFLSGKLLYCFLGLCDYSDKCFAVRAVGNALQPQISVINVVSNLMESDLE